MRESVERRWRAWSEAGDNRRAHLRHDDNGRWEVWLEDEDTGESARGAGATLDAAVILALQGFDAQQLGDD